MNSLKKEFDHNGTYFEGQIDNDIIPTIFIHGVGLDNTMWYPQKKEFKNKSFIYYDILNHGNTTKGFKNLTFIDFNNQLNNLLSYLEVTKINLVGFSIGALIAQHFTMQNHNKINKLILIGSVYKRTEDQIKKVKNRFTDAKKGKSITTESIYRWFTESFLSQNPDVYNFFYNLLESKKNNDFIPAYKVFIESDNKELNFTNFKMPTLIMTGENEIGSTPKMSEDLHKKINNSILYIIKNAKHGATIEKADDVNKQINNFLFT